MDILDLARRIYPLRGRSIVGARVVGNDGRSVGASCYDFAVAIHSHRVNTSLGLVV
jgi:hypothetical protein